MQVGDLIKYNPSKLPPPVSLAIVLHLDIYGDTLQAIDQTGEIRWMVKSGCEVINESR